MDIDIFELSEHKARLVLSGVSVTFANALRRSIISEVPILAIDYVNIYDNTSVLFDEQLALRLGLIPLKNNKINTFPEDCDCKVGCSKCQTLLTLSAEGPKMVYSEDMISTDPEVIIVDTRIPIVELKERHKVVVEAVARLGTGREHTKWQAGIAGYKNMPVITIGDRCDLCGNCAEECPRNILSLGGEKVVVTDIIDCSLCRLCENICSTKSIKITEDPKSFVVTIETIGSMTADELVISAVETIKKKADQLGKMLEMF